jgi:ribosomal protein S18 acetylase RimI-like enzyme
MNASPVVAVARPDEWAAAFHLLFQDLSESEQRWRVINALRMTRKGELNPEGILVIRDPDGLRAALTCLPMPGACGLVWPPRARPGIDPNPLQDRLLRHACAWMRACGVKLAQTLLCREEVHLGEALKRNGFTHITRLSYLRHDLDLPRDVLFAEERLSFQAYDRTEAGSFAATLERTYIGTLDCPEVNNVRTIEEVIRGHQAQGSFRARNWWMARERDRPVGVMMVTEAEDFPAWELAYFGVVPEARRRGIGREMLRKALFEARAAEARQLTLSVDNRNLPARNLYQRFGFEAYDGREVYLAVWR